jgi:hypothetical protein
MKLYSVDLCLLPEAVEVLLAVVHAHTEDFSLVELAHIKLLETG